jgi:hypothetical protein
MYLKNFLVKFKKENASSKLSTSYQLLFSPVNPHLQFDFPCFLNQNTFGVSVNSVLYFQPFKNRRKAESSELYTKPSQEAKTTLHSTPLFQCTQITSGYPNTNNQYGKHINEVVHCLIITCTRTHQIFNNLKSTKMRSLDLKL